VKKPEDIENAAEIKSAIRMDIGKTGYVSQTFFLSLFATYRSLQNDNGHVKNDTTVKFTTWNLKI
jgi:hypothetical protein